MTDQEIINLYWARDEKAIGETAGKYGGYCGSIARNILHDKLDAEECVNDTWLHTWKSIPPNRPHVFPAYLGTITRNLSLSFWRNKHAKKRQTQKLAIAYEELEECIPERVSVEELEDSKELGRTLSKFLLQLPPKDACIMIRRYWYLDSISQIAQRYALAEGTVKSKLHRVRKRLQVYLEQEGYPL